MQVTRYDNGLVVAGGSVNAQFKVVDSDGAVVPLDNQGNLVISDDVTITLTMSGLGSNSDYEAWIFSTPTRLGTGRADASGYAGGKFAIPAGLPTGQHRIVLEGTSATGDKATLAVGVRLTRADDSSGGAISKVIVGFIAAASLFALIIPPSLRRRRRRVTSS